MNMSRRLIDCYKAIEDSSLKMLCAAKSEDWEQVVRYEGVCAVLIEQLRAHAQTENLPSSERAEKAQIMQRILRNDAQIRYLAEPWLDQCQQTLDVPQQLLH